MPDSTKCEVCGQEIDTRGLSGHMETHEAEELAPVLADASEAKKSDDGGRVLAKARTEENSVTVRAMHEIVVNDEKLKREVVEELKKMVSDGGFKPRSSERRFD